ncbi:uncharacterized protein BDV17DRAFT_294600 [Aspergillus undulatus]|uniref:uncharacterized protein n=1 Tax=Aspergillus undulatus TaxID=1810928 RepID=UPI003CCD7329
MAAKSTPQRTQYNHYIPQFILKEFSHGRRKDERGFCRETIHVFDLATEQFNLQDVNRACGAQDLYYDTGDENPMRIEHLFSKLENRVAQLFRKIKDAVAQDSDHIDIVERDVQILFRFMHLSLLRSEAYKEGIESPGRENDFMFQAYFEAARKRGRSGEPKRFWLDQLLYLLETGHEDILGDAANPKDNPAAYTFKGLMDRFALQVWKAAEGYEFFVNERLVDFEGDTETRLGSEIIGERCQLMYMTNEDMIHMVLPVSPQLAVVFCDGSRCWESPFAEAMHRAGIPYPENSRMKNAPHKDIVAVDVPQKRTSKKTYPATTAWRVSIGTLSPEHHRIITSYSLCHAKVLIVVQNRRRFEKAKQDLEVFSQRQIEQWQSRGVQYGPSVQPQTQTDPVPLTNERLDRLVDRSVSALDQVRDIAAGKHEVPPFTKDAACTFWRGVLALEMINLNTRSRTSTGAQNDGRPIRIMHPALQSAFEAAYPPKDPSHRDLNINFPTFITECLSEKTFRELCQEIEKKTDELVSADTFRARFEASLSETDPCGETNDHIETQEDSDSVEFMLPNPAFKTIYRIASVVDTIVWMFEERQDILATFVSHNAVSLEESRPRVIRFRGTRN